MIKEVQLKVGDVRNRDKNKGIARIDQTRMMQIGVNIGDVIEITGVRLTSAKAWPAYPGDKEKGIIRMDEITRKNAGVSINENVIVRRANVRNAESVTLEPHIHLNVDEDFMKFVKDRLQERTFVEGDIITISMLGHPVAFNVVKTEPSGVVKVAKNTILKILPKPYLEMIESPKKEEAQDHNQHSDSSFSQERRKQVLDFISAKAGLGIPIQESYCSIEQQREISDLAICLEEREVYLSRVQEIENNKKSTENWVGMISVFVLIILMGFFSINVLRIFSIRTAVGLITILIIFVGVIPLSVAYILVRRVIKKYDVKRKILLQKANEIDSYFKTKGEELANSIKNYILTSSMPQIFMALLKTAEERGITLKTECPNCRGILDVTEMLKAEEVLKCKYCGKSISALNIYRKIQAYLG